jgi:dTDP-4-dehydrorhamnose reductase
MTRILILGATGMLGSAVFRLFAQSEGFDAMGTARSSRAVGLLPNDIQPSTLKGIDAEDFDSLAYAMTIAKPDVVVNCIGVVKQVAEAEDPLTALPINSILPHRLARLCDIAGARLIHISTDCVFSGCNGNYVESDHPDAIDLYGRSKLLGEVDYPHAITLRTSIVGHELDGARSLLCWFLAQQSSVRGFTHAVFSGLPTVELARVIRDFVLPASELRGLYHVSAAPISKFDLLTLFAKAYGKDIEIIPTSDVVIDRTLDSTRFQRATGYKPPSWPELVSHMAEFS